MPNVVFLHPDLGIGGAERLVVDAAVALKRRGHTVTMVTSHLVVVTTTLHYHIQGIIRCRVVVRCIDMDVSFNQKKVHMSEKHTKLKVLTKIIIYPESLNALVSIYLFKIPIGGVFSTKKEL